MSNQNLSNPNLRGAVSFDDGEGGSTPPKGEIKDTANPVKGGPARKLTDPPPKGEIKDVVVADPSVEFTINLWEEHFPSADGIYINDFQVEVFLDNLDPADRKCFTLVATINIVQISQLGLYFYVPFGDPDYNPGQTFQLKLRLSGKNPVDGKDIIFFNNNTCILTVIGGGIVR